MTPAPALPPAAENGSAANAATAGTPVSRLEATLRRLLPSGARILPHEPLARRTTLRVGGCADLLVEPADDGELSLVVRTAREQGVPWRVIGRGSNLLVRDGGVRGLVISLAAPGFAQLEVSPPLLRCGAGVRLKDLATTARRHGLAGLEFLAGIPGSVGGALRMNAGAWNSMTFERVESVRFLTPAGELREARGADIPSSYRRCDLFRDHIALGATFRGDPSTPEQVEARLNELNGKRWASQPAAPSAGCIFKNPAAIPAGRLIDELGLKGTRIGGAAVSDVHGNFIVNDGQATAKDVLSLIELIRARAREARGIELETEVEILGE